VKYQVLTRVGRCPSLYRLHLHKRLIDSSCSLCYAIVFGAHRPGLLRAVSLQLSLHLPPQEPQGLEEADLFLQKVVEPLCKAPGVVRVRVLSIGCLFQQSLRRSIARFLRLSGLTAFEVVVQSLSLKTISTSKHCRVGLTDFALHVQRHV
jgi:hypothetical protein